VTGRPDTTGCGDALFASAGGHVKDATSFTNIAHVQHEVGCLAQPFAQQGSPAVPGIGGFLPLRAGGFLETNGAECGVIGGAHLKTPYFGLVSGNRAVVLLTCTLSSPSVVASV